MVKKIMRDPLFLAQKSVDATEDDKSQWENFKSSQILTIKT